MTDLEKALAKRLISVWHAHHGTWMEVAKECVRQMEWARRDGWTQARMMEQGGGPYFWEYKTLAPLTLAAKEWKP